MRWIEVVTGGGAILLTDVDLLEQLRRQVRAYLDRELPLIALPEWLERHDSEVAASDTQAVKA